MLTQLQKLIDECMATTSTNEKIAIIAKHPGCKDLLRWTYDSFITFGVTAKSVKTKGPELLEIPFGGTLESLLAALSNRTLTGHNALRAVYDMSQKHGDIVYRIIDKDLKCRISRTLINKAFPNLIKMFDVALAKSYNERKGAMLAILAVMIPLVIFAIGIGAICEHFEK